MSGFDSDFVSNVHLSFMQSDGGLCLMPNFSGFKAVLSGPAGGVVGYVETTLKALENETKNDEESNIIKMIGFDMGGTSTDVSRFNGIEFEHIFENTISGITIQAPQLDINTVAAGGGSCLYFENGLFKVGPKSAGAIPGPVCYKRKNGLLAVTDANLILGRIIPEFFPKIFGETRNECLGILESKKAFEKIQQQINNYYENLGAAEIAVTSRKTIPEIAMGFIKVANETMCRPIRNITMGRGYDASSHILSCFGGAGGQHACAIAKSLKINRVIIHRFAGILSAFGMGLADVVNEKQVSFNHKFEFLLFKDSINQILIDLAKNVSNNLIKDGFVEKQIVLKPYLNLRFDGSDNALFIQGNYTIDLNINDEKESKVSDELLKSRFDGYKEEFLKRYKQVASTVFASFSLFFSFFLCLIIASCTCV